MKNKQKSDLILFTNNKVLQDQNKRKLYKKYEQLKKLLQTLIRENSTSYQEKKYYLKKLRKIPRNASKVRIRNRCVLTGRAKSVYKSYKISRIKFRELAAKGALQGVTKASW